MLFSLQSQVMQLMSAVGTKLMCILIFNLLLHPSNEAILVIMRFILAGPIIYAGCFAATLSSALSCMVSGAKTFQALCKDEVYPYLTRFGIGYTDADAPYWSYALGFLIALVFILIGMREV